MIQQTSFPSVTNLISLADAKAHLRVEHDDDDTLINTYMEAARDMVERYTGVTLDSTTKFAMYVDHLHAHHLHEWTNIHLGPHVRLDVDRAQTMGVTYLHTDGRRVVLDASDYQFDGVSYPARLRIIDMPTDVDDTINAWRIDMEAGHTQSTLPSALIAAMLLIIGHLYENRQDVSTMRTYELPVASRHLMNPFRLKSFT
ncbi:head-tail connector protein [Flavobacteriales bacterium]|nr:head-tail connector protein [Flavobacteriales bacterium]